MTPETFKAWRKRLGLTQAQAANELGISRSMWVKLETGEKQCQRERIYGLAMAAILYGCPPYGGS